uniref:GOLD domain-containing protein n=1 Tax=Rhabditophanes sp. KR3021 TaxID=114890 RepID=A0AC35TYH9_9BILA
MKLLLTTAILLLDLVVLTHNLTIIHVIDGKKHKLGDHIQFEVRSSSEMPCFYETIEKDNSFGVTLDVVNRESADLQFRITSPSKQFSEWYKSSPDSSRAQYDGIAEEEGDYEICINAYVSRTPLRLNLGIVSYSKPKIEQVNAEHHMGKLLEEVISEKLTSIGNKIFQTFAHVRVGNIRIKKDEFIQETNLNYIDTLSVIQTLIMILCSVTQVYFIRNFFNDRKNKVRI